MTSATPQPSSERNASTPLLLNLGSTERSVYGVTVTIRREDTNELRVKAVTGAGALEALRVIVDSIRLLRALGEPWFVCSISTPSTIYRDMQASRLRLRGRDGQERYASTVEFPEVTYLQRTGALDLLDPRMRIPNADDQRERGRKRYAPKD